MYAAILFSTSDSIIITAVQSEGYWIASPDLPLCCRPLTTLSRLESQWGEPRSEAASGTDARVAGSSVIVVGPAVFCGQPSVLVVLAVNPDLTPVCQVGEEERAGRVGVASLLFVGLGRGAMFEVSAERSYVHRTYYDSATHDRGSPMNSRLHFDILCSILPIRAPSPILAFTLACSRLILFLQTSLALVPAPLPSHTNALAHNNGLRRQT